MVFFGKIHTPLSDTKVDDYSDREGDSCVENQMFFLEYISDDRDSRPKVLSGDKNTERNGKALEWGKLRHCFARTIFLLIPSN